MWRHEHVRADYDRRGSGNHPLDIEQCLAQLDYQVTVACKAREAIEKVRAFRPDLVLMDINLNGLIDGIELAQQLQEISAAGIVYLTAHGKLDVRVRTEKTRPLGFLLKPFEVSDLQLAIEVALCRQQLHCTARGQAAPFVLDVRCLEQPLMHTQPGCPLEAECSKSLRPGATLR